MAARLGPGVSPSGTTSHDVLPAAEQMQKVVQTVEGSIRAQLGSVLEAKALTERIAGVLHSAHHVTDSLRATVATLGRLVGVTATA